MRALVVGSGSIGRRHIANLLRLRGIDEIFVYSRRKDGLAGFPAGKVRRAASIASVKADFAMICNETSRHLGTAAALAGRGIPLFIEKPLAHRTKGIERLRAVVRRRRVPVFVGYNLRFLGALRVMRGLLRRGAVGKPFAARIEAGQFLPDWRPGRDWRKGYSADRARGGGVALDLSHEIDYMRWLFGEPVSWRGERSHAGGLAFDAEDLFEGIYRYKNGFLCSVHLDYLQRPPRRLIRVTGARGVLECDLVGKRMTLESGGRRRVWRDPALFDVPRTYEDELRFFLEGLKSRRRLVPGLEDGVRALELIGV